MMYQMENKPSKKVDFQYQNVEPYIDTKSLHLIAQQLM